MAPHWCSLQALTLQICPMQLPNDIGHLQSIRRLAVNECGAITTLPESALETVIPPLETIIAPMETIIPPLETIMQKHWKSV
jgi:hypothetical protein